MKKLKPQEKESIIEQARLMKGSATGRAKLLAPQWGVCAETIVNILRPHFKVNTRTAKPKEKQTPVKQEEVMFNYRKFYY